MCQKCLNLLTKEFEKHNLILNEEMLVELLWSSTCFPAGDPETVRNQVVEHLEAYLPTDSEPTFEKFVAFAIAKADKEMDEAIAEFKRNYPLE